ncbi:hypothetical protein AK812_SmicGene36598 [Symbiodinium microadriaticum]|uniref:Uncharacterized protein n=1 Tax=Symbiodinium microadriaticum TaxID=2951 RepID=A0A1Q9CIG4_SYMMI|nr:hypothetical protein AK812_SmicGene36598 [Symbiodinium microadriaticum]
MHVSAQSCIVQAFSSGCALLTLCLQLSALPRPFMSMTALQVMESHMKDALRQEIQDVTSQEILAAADQANLLSAMMCRSAGALDKPAPSNPGQGSTGPSTPSAPPREAEVATTPGPEPEPMETQRDKRAAESANPAGKGNGDQEKWPKPFAKGNARSSGPCLDWPNRQERSDRHWRSDSDNDRDKDKAILNLCLSMGRFGINRSQDNYVMFAQCQGMLSMVPELYVAAEAWKTMKKETPALLTLPLRAWLLKHWVDRMPKRVEMIMTSEETIQQAKDMLILDEQCNVPYLEWNRTTRALQVKRDRDPMTLTQVLELLKTMQTLVIQPMTVMRFHATRELCQDMKAEVVPLLLQVGSRTAEGHQLWNSPQRLCHSAACRVTAVSLRGGRMGRSALGVAVQKLVEDMYGA